MKKMFLKNHRHVSYLGTAVFHNVPALIDDDGDELISGDIIDLMERQVGLKFYQAVSGVSAMVRYTI